MYCCCNIFTDNWQSQYLKKGEVSPGVQAGKYDGEVRSDITTSFFILLAIFFPSVTGRLAVKVVNSITCPVNFQELCGSQNIVLENSEFCSFLRLERLN